ncbi:DUF134 domain-containing protein [Candidatus Woesearchaeota archaeon]|nr:DUF134 domain-containing protein [Candidatus Woesearchaeota archaeon]
MVRPRKTKLVSYEPDITYFKPRAVPLTELQEVELNIDELETLRLTNLCKMSQLQAAKSMGIHQSTFQRALVRAREKITDALVKGKAIKIKGGKYQLLKAVESKLIAERSKDVGAVDTDSKASLNDFRSGISGYCICSACGYKKVHYRGIPCTSLQCPECRNPMIKG